MFTIIIKSCETELCILLEIIVFGKHVLKNDSFMFHLFPDCINFLEDIKD